mgnify:FL=1
MMTYTNGILVACDNQSLEVSCAFYDILQALCVAKLFNVLGIGQNKHQHYLDKHPCMQVHQGSKYS